MYRRGNKSKIITSLVLVAVLTISIGYAAFSNTLRITPQATITPDSATFDIDFSSSNSGVVANDITPTLTGTGLTAEAAEIDNTTNPTISNLTVNFTKPGQKAVYSFYAYNNGEYLAYLNSINFINPDGKDAFITCEATDSTTQYVDDACKGIKVSIKVGSLETDVTKENISGHSLAKQTAEEVIVTIEYASGSARADGPFTVDIGDITLVYTTVDSEGESSNIASTYVGANPCTFDGELVQGAEYVNGQYTYRYMQEGNEWTNIIEEGWGVVLNDDGEIEVTSTLCSSINNKPIVSMVEMFSESSATAIDVSSFDTSNVTNMSEMFRDFFGSPEIDLRGFDTSNVTDMRDMFSSALITSLNMSGWNTSNVTDMSGMLNSTGLSSVDMTGWDTSSVTDMSCMFCYNEIENLDVSHFNTSNVTNMAYMFDNTYGVTELDLSNFDTRKVTTMKGMFSYSSMETLDLSSFDTANVTDMSGMFEEVVATTGYAKTQADADKFNNADVTLIPDTLTFQVK